MSWFGGGAKKKEAPKNAILQLRGTLDMLLKRERHLQNQMDEQEAIARKNVNTNKNGTSRRQDQCEVKVHCEVMRWGSQDLCHLQTRISTWRPSNTSRSVDRDGIKD